MPSNNAENIKQGGVYIGLGANLARAADSPAETLAAAISALAELAGEVVAVSSFWSSPAWPDPSDPPYTNAALELATALSPEALLDVMQEVEAAFGRTRDIRWASRTLDLDIIDFRGECRSDGRLDLPHPRAVGRAFVLLPLQEIAPGWTDPVSGARIDALIAGLAAQDVGATRKLQVSL